MEEQLLALAGGAGNGWRTVCVGGRTLRQSWVGDEVAVMGAPWGAGRELTEKRRAGRRKEGSAIKHVAGPFPQAGTGGHWRALLEMKPTPALLLMGAASSLRQSALAR